MKIKLIPIYFLLGVLFLNGSCQSNSATPQSVGISEDSLNIATQRLHKYVDEGKLPGTYVKIIKDGKVVYDDKYGFIDIDEKEANRGKLLISNFFNDQTSLLRLQS